MTGKPSSKTKTARTTRRRASSVPVKTFSLVREIQIHSSRKSLKGWVANHYACGWSTRTQLNDEDLTMTGEEKANILLRDHLATCPQADDLSIPY